MKLPSLNLKKLNSSGFSHEFLGMATVLIVAIVGVGYMVASHAATNPSGPIVGIASKCLDNNANRKADFNKIQLYTCNGTAAQNWTYTNAGTIVNSNGYCLDVKSASTTSGTPVDLYLCNGTAAQDWKVNASNNTIVNPHSNDCLNDESSGTANGTQVQIYSCNGSAAQVWKVPQATPAPTVSLSASPNPVNSGTSSTLTWSSTDATSCTATGAWSGSQTTVGTRSTAALSANQTETYNLSCTGSGGSVSASTNVVATAPNSLYVSTTGSDNNAGTASAPFLTVQKAASLIKPGQVIYIRGGTYANTQIKIANLSGTATQPVTIRDYPGESVVLDGANVAGKAVFELDNSKYVNVEDITAQNAGTFGFLAYLGQNINFFDNVTNNTGDNGMVASGSYITFNGNTVSNAVESNANDADGSGGWSQGLSSLLEYDGTRSSYISFINNTVHDTWGECIGGFGANDVTITGNTTYNCFSADIYLDNTNNDTVSNNYSYQTNASHERDGDPARGIWMGNEQYNNAPDKTPDHDIAITNNIITDTVDGYGFWYDSARTVGNSYYSIRFDDNTIANSQTAIQFATVPTTQTAPTNNYMRNNLIMGPITIGNANDWTIDTNDFPNNPGLGTNALKLNPDLVNDTGIGNASDYKPQSGSPIIGKGLNINYVTTDYWNSPRPNPPTLGASEQ
jgi:hypothetical protein